MSSDIDLNIFFIPWLVNVIFNTIVLFYFLHLFLFLHLFQFFNNSLFLFYSLCTYFLRSMQTKPNFPPTFLASRQRKTHVVALPSSTPQTCVPTNISFFLSLCSTEHQPFSSVRLLTCTISSWLGSV